LQPRQQVEAEVGTGLNFEIDLQHYKRRIHCPVYTSIRSGSAVLLVALLFYNRGNNSKQEWELDLTLDLTFERTGHCCNGAVATVCAKRLVGLIFMKNVRCHDRKDRFPMSSDR